MQKSDSARNVVEILGDICKYSSNQGTKSKMAEHEGGRKGGRKGGSWEGGCKRVEVVWKTVEGDRCRRRLLYVEEGTKESQEDGVGAKEQHSKVDSKVDSKVGGQGKGGGDGGGWGRERGGRGGNNSGTVTLFETK